MPSLPAATPAPLATPQALAYSWPPDLEAGMPTAVPKTRYVRVRCFEFAYGLLYLKRRDYAGLTDEQVAEKYGDGKGELVAAWDDRISLKYLNSLEDFTEL